MIEQSAPETGEISPRGVVRGLLLQLGLRTAGVLLGIASVALVARSLGPEGFGHFSVALGLMLVGATLSDLSVGAVAVREMSMRPVSRSEILSALLALRLVLSVLAAAGAGVVWTLLAGGEPEFAAGLWVIAALPFVAISGLRLATLARLRLGAFALLNVLQGVLWFAAVVPLAIVDAPIVAFGVAFTGVAVAQAAVTWVWVLGWRLPRRVGVKRNCLLLLRGAGPLALSGLFVATYYRLDGVLVYALAGSVQAALYAGAYRFLDAMQVLPATAGGSLLPLAGTTRREAEHSRDAVSSGALVESALRLTLVVALPATILVAATAPLLVDAVLGSAFEGAGAVLGILVLAFVPICVGHLAHAILTAFAQVRGLYWISGSAAALSVGANLAVIPLFGARGAAAVTVGVEIIVNGGMAWLVARRVTLDFSPRRVIACLGAATCMALTVGGLIPLAGIPLAVVLGVVVYGAALLASRAIGRRDLQQLLSTRGRLAA